MVYEIRFKPRAVDDLADLPKADARRIMTRIERLSNGLIGDIKRLTDHFPGYRLRVGDYRVLFHVDHQVIDIYRVVNRRDAYR